MSNNIDALANSNKEVINNSLIDIKRRCSEDPSIKEFVELLLDFDTDISHQLCIFLYDLGFNIVPNSLYDHSSIVELAHFLGAINDDFYFVVKQNDRGLFYARGEEFDSDITQKISSLINGAKKNCEYYAHKDAKRLAYLKHIEENRADVGC